MREQDGQVAAFAGRHLGRLLRAGEEGLCLNPLVDVTAPAQGRVLWPSAQGLAGYGVSKFDLDALLPGDRVDFERLGFGREAQTEGFWVLHGVRYAFAQDRWVPQPPSSHAFAYYDEQGSTWTVVRRRPDASPDGEWTGLWLPAEEGLTAEEKAVVARIAGEAAVLLDAAVTLQDRIGAHVELSCVLMQRARESADPGDLQRAGAVLQPHSYLPLHVAKQFRVSAFGKLQDLAIPLYRSLAGKPQADSGSVLAVATVSEARLCPPYEPCADQLPRTPSPPPFPLPQQRRSPEPEAGR